MKLYQQTGRMVAWRGYKYYKQEKVLSCNSTAPGVYEGDVAGKDATYHVVVDENSRLGCRCACPYADREGKICKHMIALSFAAEPEDAAAYYEQFALPMLERLRQRELREHAAMEYIAGLDKIETQRLLISMLLDGSPLELDRFLQEHLNISPQDTL